MKEPLMIVCKPDKVVPFAALKQAGMEESQKLVTDRFAGGTHRGLVPPLYDPDTLVALLELNTWHNRCCEVKATDVAGLGFSFTSVDDAESKEDAEVRAFFEKDEKHGRTAGSILTDAQKDFEALALLAIEVVRELYAPDGKPLRMTHVPSHTLRAHEEGNKFMQKRGIHERWFKRFGYEQDVNKDDGTEHALGSLEPLQRATEVIWDPGPASRSDYYGLAPIIPAVGSVDGLQSLREYNLGFFKRFGVPSYAIYISGDYNLGAKTRTELEPDGSGTLGEKWDPSQGWTESLFEFPIIRQVKQHLATIAQNPHAPLILAVPGQTENSRVEIKFVPLSVEIKEASFRLYRKDSRDEIIVAHGVPAYRIGLVETGSLGGSTAVESNRIYRDSVINPRKDRLASLINVYIIRQGFGNENLTFSFNDLDLAEETHEKETAEFLFARGAMRPVDLIKAFGEEFGLEVPTKEEWPELYEYYIADKPVRSLFTDEALAAVKGLADELLRRSAA